MADILGLDAVYAKWEKRAQHNIPNSHSAPSKLGRGSTWTTKFRAPVPDRKQRYTRNKSKPMEVEPISAYLGDFKRLPSIKPAYYLYLRPVTSRCCTCMPISRDTFVQPDCTGVPDMTNVLRLPEISCRHSRILSLFSNVTYTYRHTVRFGYPNITESVLRSHKAQVAVERTVQELLEQQGLPLDENSKVYKKQKRKCEDRLKKMLNLMKAVMSIPIFKITGWVLNLVLGSLLNAIIVQNGQLKSLKDASVSGKPLIFLPTHRSHLDYVLITYILWHFGIRAPYVAAGDNLNIFGFGPILRSLGGFFIRRRLDREAGRKDHLYRAVLKEYVEELLSRGQSLEFFVEGGRSRSGKALYPKAGLLSIVVDWVLESRNETDGLLKLDALIVPVSISYEKIMDGNFCREQMGQKKSAESFWATIKAIWNLFSTSFGNVRVDFCQPFSLKEYLAVNHSSIGVPRREDSPVNALPQLRDSMQDIPAALGQDPQSALPRAVSDNSIYGIDVAKEEEKVVVDALAKHVVYNSMMCGAIMSTNLVAFDLLIRHRQGVSMDDFIKSVDDLREKVLVHNRDLGFVGSSCDIISHACHLLGSSLVKITLNEEETSWNSLYGVDTHQNIFLTPNLSPPYVLELWYYSSPVLSVFQLKSLIACGICAAVGQPILDCSATDDVTSSLFTKESVISDAMKLAELLQYESLFIAPCKSLDKELDYVYETFIDEGFVVRPVIEDRYNEEARQWTSRIARSDIYGLHDDDMDDFIPEKQYHLGKDKMADMRFFSTILAPYIESYWLTASKLEKLLDQDLPVDDFSADVHHCLIRRVNDGVSNFSETVAEDPVKNCIRSFTDMKIVEIYTEANVRMISLTEKNNDKEDLSNLVAFIDSFKSS